jgi:hypothetical protein
MTSGILSDGSKVMRGGSFLSPAGEVRVTGQLTIRTVAPSG